MASRSELDTASLGVGFSTRDARAQGVSRSRLGAKDLRRPFWGTRQLASRDSLHTRCVALLSRLSPDAAISHSTAALLWNVPLPARLSSGSVHVTVPSGQRAPQHRDVSGHQRSLAPADIEMPYGFRMTSPARTWCELSEQCAIAELVAAGDFLIHWKSPLTSVSHLTDCSNIPSFRRGRVVRRRALALLSDRAESYRESILRVSIVLAGFPTPEVNFEIRDAGGRFVARVDLAWPRARVVIEYEGDHHRTDRAQWQRDLRRVEALQDLG
jgi:hypothetical protein